MNRGQGYSIETIVRAFGVRYRALVWNSVARKKEAVQARDGSNLQRRAQMAGGVEDEDRDFRTEEAAAIAERLGILTRDSLRALPPVEPLIESTVDKRSLVLLAGPWGSARTFLALDWACCVACGRRWQARAVHGPAGMHTSGAVLYVIAEGTYGMNARIDAWETKVRDQARELFILPRAVNLCVLGEVAEIAGFLRENEITMVVFDTLSRCMPGADENSAKDMSTVRAGRFGRGRFSALGLARRNLRVPRGRAAAGGGRLL